LCLAIPRADQNALSSETFIILNIVKYLGVMMDSINDEIKIPEELAKEVPVSDYTDKMSDLIPKISKFGAVIINKDDEVMGIIDKKAIEKIDLEIPRSLSAERFVVRTPKVNDQTALSDIIMYFYKSHSIALPYMVKGKVSKIIDRITLFKILLSRSDIKDVLVKDIMSTPMAVIDSKTDIAKAKKVMEDENMSTLGVLDDGKFYGIITSEDIINNVVIKERSPAIENNKYSPSNIPVKDYVNTNPVMIKESGSVQDSVRLMVENENKPIVVTSGSQPIGIVTSTDILEYLTSNKKEVSPSILISGLDESTYIYEDEILSEIKNFSYKISKIKDIGIRYISATIKRIGKSQYEVRMKLLSEKYGSLQVNYSDYRLERTLSEALEKLNDQILKAKEKSENVKDYFKEI